MNPLRIHATVVLAALAICSTPARAHAQSGLPQDIDAHVERTLRVFEVPGMALAVVKDGKVVVAKGYGVRTLGDPASVDADTLFGIGSNTKAFTTASLAMLVDEGKISWDDPVIKHLPAFQMYDPYVTREMRIRDLLTHRSGLGLGAGDLLIYPQTTYTRDEVIQRIRYLKPVSSFRSQYAYDNLLYLVAGQIIPAVTGTSWDDFVYQRIFAPVGMRSSATGIAGLTAGGNVAAPHSRVEGGVRAVAPQSLDNVGPAGSINSSAADMARWLIVQLDGGALASLRPGSTERLFTDRQHREMWTAQTILPVNDPPPGLEALRTNFAAYALGWGLREYRGRKTVSHTGGLLGYVSQVTLVPELKLGIVVLTNQEEGMAFTAVSNHILDAYLGAEKAVNWVSVLDRVRKAQLASAEETERKSAAARVTNSQPSLPLEKYAGRYRDPWRDEATIAFEAGKLVLRFGHTAALVGDLEHWQYDTFVARWRDRSMHADAYVTFSLEPDGTIDEMKMLPVSPLTDFSFDFQDLLFKPVPSGK
jgi:CubicO group peptidase (beta-lactamase class C family)